VGTDAPETVDDRSVGVESAHAVGFGDVVQQRDHVVAEVGVRQPDLVAEVAAQRHVVDRRRPAGRRERETLVAPELRHVQRQRVVLHETAQTAEIQIQSPDSVA